ncbi:ABC transporter ATP-binding protein [Vibrio vulnificus]|uniref:ABC transporter ATP-binding protein n=1 Tax=Vibrio vulnificus TaxID=672 RepID=UPI003ED8CFFD
MIKVNNLRFAWDKQAIIDIDTLHIQKGQHLFIEGPSGSGKSTLLNLLAGVLTAQSGEVCILGQQLNNLSSSQKDHFRSNHIGFIFQQFNLIPYLSVIDNITLPCSFSAQRKSKALQRSVNELSVGQQQRVAAARAIFGSPEIIIADEPTSALDNDHRQAFIKILFDECEKADITLIFVSHDGTLKQHFDRHITLQQLNQVPTKAL